MLGNTPRPRLKRFTDLCKGLLEGGECQTAFELVPRDGLRIEVIALRPMRRGDGDAIAGLQIRKLKRALESFEPRGIRHKDLHFHRIVRWSVRKRSTGITADPAAAPTHSSWIRRVLRSTPGCLRRVQIELELKGLVLRVNFFDLPGCDKFYGVGVVRSLNRPGN